jgi:hypothetical protein
MFARQRLARSAVQFAQRRMMTAEATAAETTTAATKVDPASKQTKPQLDLNAINQHFQKLEDTGKILTREQTKEFIKLEYPLITEYNVNAARLSFAHGRPYNLGNDRWVWPPGATRPDTVVYQKLSHDFFPKEELGNGNFSQRYLNEYMYQAQHSPDSKGHFLGGFKMGQMSINWFGQQSLLYFLTSIGMAWVGADLYRDMYIEKYNLWDMFNWESRVIAAEAAKGRKLIREQALREAGRDV